MLKLPELHQWQTQMCARLQKTPTQIFAVDQFETIDRIIFKLLLLTTHYSRYGSDYTDVMTVEQTVVNLKLKHPHTALDDLKSLHAWYPQLQQHPTAWVYAENDPNHLSAPHVKPQLLTNQLAAQLLAKHCHQFIDEQSTTLKLAEYLLVNRNKVNQFLDASSYGLIANGLFESVWTHDDYWYQYFKTADEVIDGLQNKIHEIATQDDVVTEDEQGWFSPDVEFTGYAPETIEQLYKAIVTCRNYQKRSPDLIYYFPDGDFDKHQVAKLIDMINVLGATPVDERGLFN